MKINRLFLKIKSLLFFVRSLLLSEGKLRLSKMSIFRPFLGVRAPAGKSFLHKYTSLYFYSGEPSASGARLFL